MRIIFEEDLTLAILHADLAYIDCSLEHDLPQQPSQQNGAPSPTPPQFPTTKVVRSTLEESTFDPNESSARNSRKRRANAMEPAPPPSAANDDADSFAAPVSHLYLQLVRIAFDVCFL